jgi:hypothetical protein
MKMGKLALQKTFGVELQINGAAVCNRVGAQILPQTVPQCIRENGIGADIEKSNPIRLAPGMIG